MKTRLALAAVLFSLSLLGSVASAQQLASLSNPLADPKVAPPPHITFKLASYTPEKAQPSLSSIRAFGPLIGTNSTTTNHYITHEVVRHLEIPTRVGFWERIEINTNQRSISGRSEEDVYFQPLIPLGGRGYESCFGAGGACQYVTSAAHPDFLARSGDAYRFFVALRFSF